MPGPGARMPTRSSTRCTSRASPAPPRRARRAPRHLRRTRPRGGDRAICVDLGVTAVELLPVHHSVPEAFLPQRGLTNYWGYNTIGYLRAARRLLRRGAGRAARRAGRRVPGHGRHVARGPGSRSSSMWCSTTPPKATSSARRCAIAGWTTRPTTGWTPATRAPTSTPPAPATRSTPATRSALRLIMDSLRYWLTEMHVDGFRFDLAPTLARQEGDFDEAVGVLRPRRPGSGGLARQADRRAVGRRADATATTWARFPPLWSEWNGKYRDSMRDFWRSHRSACSASSPPGSPGRPTCTAAPGAAHRLGQPDHRPRRLHPAPTSSPTTTSTTRPTARTTATAPTTTAPGTAAWKGPPTTRTSSPCAPGSRRAMLTTLLLSFGVPMLLGGDELGRTQQGNNNAYCQDNEITWFDWSATDTGTAGVHQEADRVAAGAPGLPPAALPGRAPRPPSCAGSPRPAPR